MSPGRADEPVGPGLAAASFGRFVLNTARRFAYPFAPAMARGLGVPLTAVTPLIAAGQATGLASPLFGPAGDRFGYRRLMLGSLAVMGAGMLAAWLRPGYSAVALGLFFAGLGKSAFDPAVQAWVGERVSFARRGLAIGLSEVAWSASALVGIPLLGLLMRSCGWTSVFAALGLAAMAAFGLVAALMRREARSSDRTAAGPARGPALAGRSVLAALAFGFLISAANDALFIVFGAWMEESFGLGLTSLGAAATVIGLAELGGEGLTAVLGDRLGLGRAMLGGAILSALGYALLPSVGGTLPRALAGLFVVFLTFEFTMVASLSLFTELSPGRRGAMMSGYMAALALGRVAGALAGAGLWRASGLSGVAAASAATASLAIGVSAWGLRGWRPGAPARAGTSAAGEPPTCP